MMVLVDHNLRRRLRPNEQKKSKWISIVIAPLFSSPN